MIKDLIPENSSAIFVLESPHTTETSKGTPLAGESGMVFSRVLLGDFTTPAGELIAAGNFYYGIMNTFQYPLQSDSENAPLFGLNEEINKVQFIQRVQYKNDLKKLYSQYIEKSDIENYKNRVLGAISKCPQKKLIVCGFISQAYFEYAFNLENTKFGKFEFLNINHDQVKVFYIWHPSPRSGNKKTSNGEKISSWEDENSFNKKIVSELKAFIK